MPNIDWGQAMAQAQNASFDPLPEADYDLVCVESTPTQSSTGKPMIKVKYQVETGPSAGKPVFTNYTFSADSDNALSIFFRHMAFHGLDASFFSANPAWESVAAALTGRRIRATLGIREWQGVLRNELKRVMPAATPGPGAVVTQPGPSVAPTVTPAPVQAPQNVPPLQPTQPLQQPAPVTQQPFQPAQQVPQPQPQLQPQLPPQPQGPFGIIEAQPAAQPPQQLAPEPQVVPTQDVHGAPEPVASPPQPQATPEPTPEQPAEAPPQLPEVPY